MTCIVGLVDKGSVYIGGDSCGASGYSSEVRNDPKVFQLKNDTGEAAMLVGFTSSFRMGQILQYSKLPEHPKGMDSFEWMVTKFVPYIREQFKAGGYLHVENGRESGGVFLVGYRRTLFRVDSDFQVGMPREKFSAVGCGQDLALGALWATRYDPDVTKRLRTALSAAERFSGGVRQPFHILGIERI